MDCLLRRGLVALAVCAVGFSVSRAPASVPYLEKIWTTPDYTQTDSAYGGFPDEYGVLHGGYFCGPTSTSNSLMWLANNGWTNLAPLTSDRKKDQHDLVETIASSTYMDAYEYDGVNPTRLANGLSQYIHDCGYEYSRFEWQGWRAVPSQFKTGTIPDLDWMRAGIEGPNTIQLWSVGWYNYHAETNEYSRDGGHWVTMVGHSSNGTAYDPNYFVIHDPAPRTGAGFANNYVHVEP
ncbi:MAG: hypothetical protein GX621_12695, partial [Pirellulaceae bacterium]|nr:hypothetical protein [Pirellulaceae bacterium]